MHRQLVGATAGLLPIAFFQPLANTAMHLHPLCLSQASIQDLAVQRMAKAVAIVERVIWPLFEPVPHEHIAPVRQPLTECVDFLLRLLHTGGGEHHGKRYPGDTGAGQGPLLVWTERFNLPDDELFESLGEHRGQGGETCRNAPLPFGVHHVAMEQEVLNHGDQKEGMP